MAEEGNRGGRPNLADLAAKVNQLEEQVRAQQEQINMLTEKVKGVSWGFDDAPPMERPG